MQWILSCFARDDFRISNRASWTRLYTLNKNKTQATINVSQTTLNYTNPQ